MTFIQIKDTKFSAAVSGMYRDQSWDFRRTKSITCELTYEEAKALFTDGVEWYLVYQEPDYTNEDGETVTPDPIVYDNTEFELVGSITENRDGTVTVKMGKITAEEALAELIEVLGE